MLEVCITIDIEGVEQEGGLFQIPLGDDMDDFRGIVEDRAGDVVLNAVQRLEDELDDLLEDYDHA